MIEKCQMESKNIINNNIEFINKYFPHCITETKDGEIVKKVVNFELLKQEFSDIIDETKEKYTLNWPGKKNALVLANKAIKKTLRPIKTESILFDTTKNLYIEGDNLDALKLLQESYLNKVKMIYIDPPYNTGKDFVYKDNFAGDKNNELEASGQIDEEGGVLVANLETNGRYHSDWLNMMYPRLKLARNLLKDDGVIFISIDDNEIHNLRKIADEVFGESNFITQFIWNSSTGGGIRSKYVNQNHEYALCYAKNKASLPMFFAPLSEEAIKQYNRADKKGKYREKDFAWKTNSLNKNQIYGIKAPDGSIIYPKKGYLYRFVESKFLESLNNDEVVFKETSTGPLVDENGNRANYNIYIKKYLDDGLGAPTSVVPKSLVGISNIGTEEIKNLFNDTVFNNPKSTKYLQYLFEIGNLKNEILLDFFSGSCSSAHTIMKLNAEDGGNRRFIMVQIPEETDEKSGAYKAGYKTICEIGKERIRRAGTKILEENKDKEGIESLDIGFRVFKVDSSNMKDVYYNPDEIRQDNLFDMVSNIKEDRTDLDLLFQVLLDSGVELTLPIEEKQIADKKVYFVDGNVLVACFEDSLTEEFVTELAKCDDLLKVVFRDSSFGSDDSRINVEQIFKQYSPDTQIRVI